MLKVGIILILTYQPALVELITLFEACHHGDDLVNPDLWVINNFKEIISTQGISDRRLNSLFST